MVRSMTIDDNDDRPIMRTNDLLQELDEHVGIEMLHCHIYNTYVLYY